MQADKLRLKGYMVQICLNSHYLYQLTLTTINKKSLRAWLAVYMDCLKNKLQLSLDDLTVITGWYSRPEFKRWLQV